jgi:hypothetical protein
VRRKDRAPSHARLPMEGKQAVGRAWLLARMQPPVGVRVVGIRGWPAGGAVPSRLESSHGPAFRPVP